MVFLIYSSVTRTIIKSYKTSCTYIRLWWILLVPGDRCLVARSSTWGPWSSLWNIFVFLWGCRASAQLLPHLWTDLKGKGHRSVSLVNKWTDTFAAEGWESTQWNPPMPIPHSASLCCAKQSVPRKVQCYCALLHKNAHARHFIPPVKSMSHDR